jgi:zinc protease
MAVFNPNKAFSLGAVYLIVFQILLLFILGSTAHAQEKIFNSKSFHLENGLQVILIENHRAPVVTHMVWYKVGAADEPPGKSGIAHFMEHLMFKGSEGFAPGEFSKHVRSLGGQDNAFTSQDFTAYFQSIAVDHLPEVMKMEAGRMRGMNPPLEEVLSERLVILEERKQRVDNNPKSHFNEQLRYALFPNHPYGTPVIGWYHEMEQLEWSDAKGFYDKWYRPNNAILVVSGDITLDELKPLVQEAYGNLESAEIPLRDWTTPPPLPGTYEITLKHEHIKQPTLVLAFRTPSAAQNKETSLALELFEEIMSGGSSTRLYKSLVVDKKLATNISLSYDSIGLGETTVSIYAYPNQGIDLVQLKEAIYDELRSVIESGVNEQEIKEAKSRMIDASIYARDSIKGAAMIFGMALTSGVSIDDIEYWHVNINSVTAAQIQNAVSHYLNPDNNNLRPFIIGYMLPEN